MEFIIDFQGFKSSTNEFIVKELALISIDSQVYELYLFKPPCDFMDLPRCLHKQIAWLERHHHGIFWSYGVREYKELGDVFANIQIKGNVYVKGKEKQRFVISLLSNFEVKVINLEDLGCPSLKELKSSFYDVELMKPCTFNHNGLNCAYVNAQALLQWWKIEKLVERRLEMVNKAIKECYSKGYRNINTDLIKYLPREFLVNHFEDIEIIYDKLPEKLKSDNSILINMRCEKHYGEIAGDTFDGPNPKRKHCLDCLFELHNNLM
jgi:hypothetical protein